MKASQLQLKRLERMNILSGDRKRRNREYSEAAPASDGKPRYQIRGHPDFDKYLKQLRQSNR